MDFIDSQMLLITTDRDMATVIFTKRSFTTSLNCQLGPFRVPNTKTDFSWSISGTDGSISLNLNSYGRLQLRHNAYGERVFILNEELGIQYEDYQNLGMEIAYIRETEILSVSYSVDEILYSFYEGGGNKCKWVPGYYQYSNGSKSI